MQEKDTAANVNNHYQSITFQQPYQRYSFEELRLADYNQGRRYGNGSGQAGAFGTSAFGGSGFGSTGGFGSNQPSSFGAATSAPSTFGQTQTTGGFGSSSTNPLFGASKPATSLFGSTSGTSQPSLFGGTTGTTGGGFGSGTGTGGFGTGSSLFGNNQQQNKPSLFGSNTGTSGFGSTPFGQQQSTSTSTPFGGSTSTSTPFGTNTQQTGTGGFGGFGTQNQNQPQKSLFGGFGNTGTQQQSGSSLFGGGGTGTTGGSLFGSNNQQQQPGTSLFGGGASQQPGTGSSLFGGGNQQTGQKSLFGGTGTTGPSTGTGPFSGFGTSQSQPSGGTGLFGNTPNQQQQKPLFGGGTGGSLFGGQNTATQNTGGSSLFGGNTQPQQPAAGGFGSSLFGGGQQSSLFGQPQQPQQPQQPMQQPQQPVPGSLQASLLEGNPYGNQSIFSGLPGPNTPSPGPLATPLSSSVKQKQRTPLPTYKITPNAANRLITPPKRQGYGFSYSTYGTPSSSVSASGGLGGSFLGGSLRGGTNGGLGQSINRSLSTSNLRKSFDPDTDSILTPGALSSSSVRPSSNLKRLTVDRSLRTDLFSRSTSGPAVAITDGEDAAHSNKKRVSFDAETPAQISNGDSNGREIAVTQTQSPEPTPEELGFLRSVRREGSSTRANVPEEPPRQSNVSYPQLPSDTTQTAKTATNDHSRLPFTPGPDPSPGEYFMQPSRAEIERMPREQLKRVNKFVVGRKNCGSVIFDEPVDLTTIDLNKIFGTIVVINVRSITVYPPKGVEKPPVGKGLNVPSILRIENSWPRGRDKKSPSPYTSGPLFEKHVDRLRKVNNTKFITYEKSTGTWVFKVAHFTTYGFDYDSDEDDNEDEPLDQSMVSAPPETPSGTDDRLANRDHTMDTEATATYSTNDSFVSSTAGVNDDTFEFKRSKMVPGTFGNQAMNTEEGGNIEEREQDAGAADDESFLDDGSTGSITEQESDNVAESQHSGDDSEVESGEDEEMEMAGSFPNFRQIVGQDDDSTTRNVYGDSTTRPVLKPWGTPPKAPLDLSGDWDEHLQRTISPRKQNRDALREIQASAFSNRLLQSNDDDIPAIKHKSAGSQQKKFSTSIDLMNSLFHNPRKQSAQSKGFEV